jgi:hypothetical protein
MASFLYFFPRDDRPQWTGPPVECGKEIARVLAGAGFESSHIEAGPGRQSGRLLAVVPPAENGGDSATLRHFPNGQEWRPIEVGDKVRYWLGWEKDRKPTQRDVARSEAIDGFDVKLADGNRWKIPAVKAQWDTLPRVIGLGADGKIEYRPVSGNEALILEAELWFNLFWAGEKITYEGWRRFISHVLTLNYHVGEFEVAAMELLSPTAEQIRMTVGAAIGALQVEEVVELLSKKNLLPDTIDSSPGEVAA